jgi:SAM-dependent methyltransferase
MNVDTMECEICCSPGGTIHHAREMMFGSGDEFQYLECQTCGCLSLLDVPSDLSKYYPDDYYSLGEVRGDTSLLRKLRDFLYLSPLSFLVNWRYRLDLDVIRRCKLTKKQKFLDVGCGSGLLLRDLRELGYCAEGVDPFVSNDIPDRFGIRVFKKSLEQVSQIYDLILFRHSLEHIPHHVEVLRSARKRLRPGGTCVVCIPVVGWAWREYGIHWSQLDAPRHLFIHSVESFSRVAEKAGFRIERVIYDSSDFQFWTSDLYREGKQLQGSDRPGWVKLMKMRRRAKALNQAKDGDSVQIYMT